MSAVNDAWQRRGPRERTVLGSIALAVGAVLLYTFAWLPLERARVRLAAEVPRLRASVAALEREAEAVARLKSMPPRAPSSAPVSALSATAMQLPGAQVAALDDRRVRVTGADVGFTALLDWLAAARASHGLRVESARLEALPLAGRVRAELVLTRG